eukprot:gene54360-74468_t
MVASMKPGSVLVDLAVERGGNVEGVKANEVVDLNGVKLVGYTNLAGRVPASASSLYARNLFSFIETLVDKSTKALAVNWDDELGRRRHPSQFPAESGGRMTDVFPRASSSPFPVGERSRLLARVRAPLNSLIPLTRLT